ncbi:protein JASON isoform X2 [Telopea speciosissima]|uniref:protein JASON isoform X2 n=1 Tax=Telopea speciosissima TaxID=54955 RepID=UPI001CC67E0E|nr:protein JASON isoform X2 [Telopea speciosissima]XP_043698588.1 protein JASON isoform X2 [Telopea speciosissima]
MEEREDSGPTRPVSLSWPRSPWSDFGFVLGLLRRMGCFFGCFRVKYDNQPHAHVVSDAVASKKRDALLSGNKLGSLFLSEERESSPCKGTGCHTLGSALLERDGEVRELRDEAKFLKACGTLLETPAEIRKALEKVKDSPTSDGDSQPSRLHSWLSSSSVKKLHWEEQPDQVSISPGKLREELGGELGSPEHEPSSCMSKGDMVEQNFIKEDSKVSGPDTEITNPVCTINNDKLSSVTPEPLTENIQSRNKSVRFECEYPSDGKCFKQSDVPGSHNGSNCSPYPTPLRLTDEMQTPGTIFPVSLENHANGKNARIRSQYVYPVLNPVENFSQWKVLTEEDGTYQQIGHQRESFEQSGHATPQRTSISLSSRSEMFHDGAATVGKDVKLDASLAQWLKPSLPKNDKNQNSGGGSLSIGKSPKMSDEDRPIIGMVAAHWSADEISHVSPKWWDGNGIPNSTNKYKEDQRVSWHATPFEERLEKALSEESNVYQSISVGGLSFLKRMKRLTLLYLDYILQHNQNQ